VAKPIVFLSDYGLEDEFVGICHGVMARISPESRIIDLTHGIPPQDVLKGAVVLARSTLYMPKDAVYLAVVDPGVGSDRRAIAVEDEAGFVTVGPDNGLLSLAWIGGAARAVEISSPETLLEPVSPTFHGRDVFSPAAAHLARGASLADLGPEASLGSLVRLDMPEMDVGNEWLRAKVLGVDRFGNVQLSLRPEDLDDVGMGELAQLPVYLGEQDVDIRRVVTFAELDPDEDGLIVDSSGWLALVRNGGNASQAWELGSGDDVLLHRPD
jgi:S-adenosyl-L-methionine hydrolase (adenosine-forming)